MAQDCPLCFSKSVFTQWTNLKDSLVSLSTRTFTCPLCFGTSQGLDKFTLHLVSHEMEAKKNEHPASDVPTLSIKEGSNLDTLDELLADFPEFFRQEDHHNKLKIKSTTKPLSSPTPPFLSGTIQTPLPLPQTIKPNLLMTPSLNVQVGIYLKIRRYFSYKILVLSLIHI